MGLGLLNSEYLFYFSAFQFIVFIFINIYLKLNLNLNKYYMYFSYSIILLILTFFIDFALIVYFFIFITPFTVFLSHRFYLQKNILKRVLIIIIINVYTIFSVILVHENIFYYNNFKKNYIKDLKLTIYDINNNPINFDKNKVYVLDIWTTSCGVCIEKFPDFSSLCEKYSDNSNLEFYSVNVKLNETERNRTLKYVLGKNYCFKNLFINSKDEVNKIDVYEYPTIIIIKNNKIIYNGYPSFNSYVLFNNLNNIIEENIIN